jgi:hypothetical protein
MLNHQKRTTCHAQQITNKHAHINKSLRDNNNTQWNIH